MNTSKNSQRRLLALGVIFALGLFASPAFSEENQSDTTVEEFVPYSRDFAGPPYIPSPLLKKVTSAYESVYGPLKQKARLGNPTVGGPQDNGGDDEPYIGPGSGGAGHGGSHGGSGHGGSGHGGSTANQTPQEKLTFLLSGYEAFPSRADLDKVAPPPQMEKMLIDLVAQGDNDLHRMRAVDLLGLYNSPKVIDFLNKLAHSPTKAAPGGAALTLDPRLAVSFQHRGIVALAKATKEEGVHYLEDLLASDDLQIQLTTVAAVGKNCGMAGRAALQELMKHNPDPLVKEEAARYVM